MSKKKPLPLLENIEIADIAAEGKAICRVDNMVVFVSYGAPGDVVDIQLTKKRKQHAEGRIVRWVEKSPMRCEPGCAHFGVCGGCQWRHIPYEVQLQAKQRQVFDNLTRLARIELPEMSPIIGAEHTDRYRNKLEFTFSNKKWRTREELDSGADFSGEDNNALGFHIPGMFNRVLDIGECHLQEEFSDTIRLDIKQFCLSNGYDFFDLNTQTGLMRNLVVRTASTGEKMLIVVFARDEHDKIEALMKHIADTFPEITSLQYVVNTKCNDTLFDQTFHVYKGRDHILERMEDLQFKVGPKSFYQTNSAQALRLYDTVRRFADLKGDELVYDLYTGTGTIANFLARKARRVIGVEYVPEAIEDAKVNAGLNSLDNTIFFAGDCKDILNRSFIDTYGVPDVLVADPPRAGMHEDVIRTILAAAPKCVVYVSCNPATQARDLALLDTDYKVVAIQPVDMFPHTMHVENVVKLVHR